MSDRTYGSYSQEDPGQPRPHFSDATSAKYNDLQNKVQALDIPQNEKSRLRLALEKLIMFAADDAQCMIRQAWREGAPVLPYRGPELPISRGVVDFKPRRG